MGQDILDFYNQAVRKDFARLFQFRVQRMGKTEFSEADLVYLETASLPGRTITNVPVPYMGLAFNVPGTASYPGSAGYQVQFRCDAAYDIRSILEEDTFNTFDEKTSTGDYRIPGRDSVLVFSLFTGGSGPDATPQKVRTYTLHGVYVQAIADLGYDIKDTGTIATVQATLAYQFWTAEADAVFTSRRR